MAASERGRSYTAHVDVPVWRACFLKLEIAGTDERQHISFTCHNYFRRTHGPTRHTRRAECSRWGRAHAEARTHHSPGNRVHGLRKLTPPKPEEAAAAGKTDVPDECVRAGPITSNLLRLFRCAEVSAHLACQRVVLPRDVVQPPSGVGVVRLGSGVHLQPRRSR